MDRPSARNVNALQGVLIGTAVGDSLGLPYEGMSKRRVRRMLGDAELRHHFAFGRGMVSDDTDHACFVALALAEGALAEEQTSPLAFAKRLASRLRWWLAALPAGVGFGTLRAITKLWLGFSPANSGVWSAGNGPAMRAPIIGAYFSDNLALRQALTTSSTRLTHTDPKAEQGARAIAAAAASAVRQFERPDPEKLLTDVIAEVDDTELLERLDHVACNLDRPTAEIVERWNLDTGITGYIYDTVPAVVHCWLRHNARIEPALREIIACGGDTDTTGAILGALCGAAWGARQIPPGWVERIVEWPRSTQWIKRLGAALATGAPAPRYFTPGTLLRNWIFIGLVYGQIVRRAFPPY